MIVDAAFGPRRSKRRSAGSRRVPRPEGRGCGRRPSPGLTPDTTAKWDIQPRPNGSAARCGRTPPILTLPPRLNHQEANEMKRIATATRTFVARGVVALALLAGCGNGSRHRTTAAPHSPTSSSKGWPRPSGSSAAPTSTVRPGRTSGCPHRPARHPSSCPDPGTCRAAESSGSDELLNTDPLGVQTALAVQRATRRQAQVISAVPVGQ